MVRWLAGMLACVVGCGARTGAGELRLTAIDASTLATDAAARDASDDAHVVSSTPDVFVADAAPSIDVGVDVTTPLGCSAVERAEFAGVWAGPVNELATITVNGDTLTGTWSTNPRPPFFGVLLAGAGPCRARVTFPDDNTYIATLTRNGCEIDWSNATTWTKTAPGC